MKQSRLFIEKRDQGDYAGPATKCKTRECRGADASESGKACSRNRAHSGDNYRARQTHGQRQAVSVEKGRLD